jgi:hypothetical protein
VSVNGTDPELPLEEHEPAQAHVPVKKKGSRKR